MPSIKPLFDPNLEFKTRAFIYNKKVPACWHVIGFHLLAWLAFKDALLGYR